MQGKDDRQRQKHGFPVQNAIAICCLLAYALSKISPH